MKSSLFSFLVISAALTFSFSARAERPEHMFECLDSKEELNWVVELKSDLSMATFYDDRYDVALKQTAVRYDDTSFPPLTLYSFKGQNGSEGKVEYTFSFEIQKGQIKTKVNTPNESSRNFECAPTRNTVDWKKVRNAIRGARKNKGSTRY